MSLLKHSPTRPYHLQLIVLLGPNGVGKTTIGRRLERDYSCRFIGIEQFFLERYPRLEDLVEHMETAVHDFQTHIQQAIAHSPDPIIFEETGVNPMLFAMIQDFIAHYRIVIVHIQTPESLCQQRVVQRGTSQNYAKDPQFVANNRKKFFEQVLPNLQIDMEFCNEDELETTLHPAFSRYLTSR